MRQPGARVEDVAELEKILKRPITLHDITHGVIFNSGKYRTGRFEEIEMAIGTRLDANLPSLNP